MKGHAALGDSVTMILLLYNLLGVSYMPTTVLSNLHAWFPWIPAQSFELENLLFPLYRWGTRDPQERSLVQVIQWMSSPCSWNGNSSVCDPDCHRAKIKALGRSLKEKTRSKSMVLILWAHGKDGKWPICWEVRGCHFDPWEEVRLGLFTVTLKPFCRQGQ